MVKKYFSLKEAQETLQKLQSIIQDAINLKKTIDEINTIEITVEDDSVLDEINFIQLNKDFHYYSYLLFEKLYEIQKHGVVIKDVETGLLDFPSLFKGREINFCFKFGELKIEYFHEMGEGFNGRKSVKEIEEAMRNLTHNSE